MKKELENTILRMVREGILYREAVVEFKKLFLTQILLDHHGNQCAAARATGMHRNTFSRTVDELKMEAGIGREQRKPPRYVPKVTERKLLGIGSQRRQG